MAAVLRCLTVSIVFVIGCSRAGDPDSISTSAEPSETDSGGVWLRPARATNAEPVWGVKGGLAVGLYPTSGPRGLIRVYAPYLGQKPGRMVNFIAIEPVVNGVRGQSELEVGLQSKQAGLEMWTGDTLADVAAPRQPPVFTPGRIESIDGTKVLPFYLATEPFRNGAKPILQVILRADHPHEVGLRVHAARDSAPMNSCVLSATMGNYGRLRRLWLSGEVVDAKKLWPTFEPDGLGFAPWRAWDRARLFKRNADVLVAATSDEADL
ncbi:MAG TPA: hypothetical protein VGG61_13020, partial [Gemmataceae bacterium]